MFFLLNIVYFSVCLTSNKLYWIDDQLADVSTWFYTSASWRRRVGPSASWLVTNFFHLLITCNVQNRAFVTQIKSFILQKFFSNPWFDFISQLVVVTPQCTAFPEPWLLNEWHREESLAPWSHSHESSWLCWLNFWHLTSPFSPLLKYYVKSHS